MKIASTESGSFRDRNGRIYYESDRVLRGISAQALANWKMLSSTKFFREAISSRTIVRTEESIFNPEENPGTGNAWAGVLEHEKIPFVSYPYEWPFGMLRDAALQQLDLLASALSENMTLKDASSFNTQWIGAMPVFIDVPSFEKYIDGTPWVGYRQFCELFLYPLMLMAYKNISYQPLLRGKIDGITPQECNNIFSFRDRLRSGVFMHVYLQSKLQSGYADSGRQVKKEIQSSGFSKGLILSNIRKLTRLISNLEWKQASSQWSDYAGNTSYTELDTAKKIDCVKSVIHERKRALVWDLGCNTGRYSRIAAENSEYVVAMDSDHLAVEYLYRDLHKELNRNILPLVMNLSDASPNLGWRGKERKELAERGKPDLILALALVHHIAISANIPIADFIDWLASMGTEVIIEFVSKDDPMAQRLLRNKDDQYDDYDEGKFVDCLRKHFQHVRKEPLSSGTRSLYHAKEPLRT